ncbi:hypothetical protein PGB90_001756 [Kerria lacca]
MSFPKEFLFSTGTSAYQIEGAWNKDGRGESIWDQVIHTTPSKVKNNHNADIACDSYNLYKDDIKIIKDIGVTIYHWDLPQALQVIGGWANPLIVDYVEDYADLLFDLFGKKVKWWITINEPREIVRGYESLEFAPCTNLDSPGNYIVGHNALRAHGRIYRLYDRKYRAEQKGKLSTTLSCNFFKGKTNSEDDIKAANRSLQFNTGWFAHPIYSKEGDYPKIMREVIDENSKKEGKGENNWDRITHTNPNFVQNNDNGDVACDSYHLYKEDVKLIKNIGFNMYRFSISWARILPDGDLTNINEAGINYYHNLIDELLQNGIQPMVKWWITINEPNVFMLGYSDDLLAPALKLGFSANYILGHNALKAHAEIFRLYDKKYRSKQRGNISLSIHSMYLEPKTTSEEDKDATNRGWEFHTTPWGLKGVLRFIKDKYNNPPVFITENGYCDSGEFEDIERIAYHRVS